MDIVSSPKVARSLPKPSRLFWEALFCEKLIPNPAPYGQKIYHGMLMPLHDSMPSFMNFRRVLDLLEFFLTEIGGNGYRSVPKVARSLP